MYRMSLEEALSQRTHTITSLQRIRAVYERQMSKANEQQLTNLRTFFDNKEVESRAHLMILQSAAAKSPNLVTKEILATKEQLIVLWRGLKEEADRRLG